MRDARGKLTCWLYSPPYNTALALKVHPRGPLQPFDQIQWTAQRRFNLSPRGNFIPREGA